MPGVGLQVFESDSHVNGYLKVLESLGHVLRELPPRRDAQPPLESRGVRLLRHQDLFERGNLLLGADQLRLPLFALRLLLLGAHGTEVTGDDGVGGRGATSFDNEIPKDLFGGSSGQKAAPKKKKKKEEEEEKEEKAKKKKSKKEKKKKKKKSKEEEEENGGGGGAILDLMGPED